jgi:hypothetical protein
VICFGQKNREKVTQFYENGIFCYNSLFLLKTSLQGTEKRFFGESSHL